MNCAKSWVSSSFILFASLSLGVEMFSCVRRKGIGEKAPDLSRLEREGGRGGKEEGREGELVHPDRASIRVI